MTQIDLDKKEAERPKKAKDQAFVAAGSASLVLEEAERIKKATDQDAKRTKEATDDESERVKKAQNQTY